MKNFLSKFSAVYFLLSILFVINCGMGANPPKVKTNPCATDPNSGACMDYCTYADNAELKEDCGNNCKKNPNSHSCLIFCTGLNDLQTGTSEIAKICTKAAENACNDPDSFECAMTLPNPYSCIAACANYSTSFGCQICNQAKLPLPMSVECTNTSSVTQSCETFCSSGSRLSPTCSSYCAHLGVKNTTCADFCADTLNPKSLNICTSYCIGLLSNETPVLDPKCDAICKQDSESFACAYYNLASSGSAN